MVIDTVADVVLGDVGEEIVSTAGVAVRPFWWSTECLEVLGLITGGADSTSTTLNGGAGATDDTGADSSSTTVSGGTGGTGGSGDTGTGSEDGSQSVEGDDVSAQSTALSGGWIALIVVLGIVAVAALAALVVLLVQGRRAPGLPAAREATVAGTPSDVASRATAATVGPANSTAPASATASPDRAAFCSQCGQGLETDDKFCPGCGRPL